MRSRVASLAGLGIQRGVRFGKPWRGQSLGWIFYQVKYKIWKFSITLNTKYGSAAFATDRQIMGEWARLNLHIILFLAQPSLLHPSVPSISFIMPLPQLVPHIAMLDPRQSACKNITAFSFNLYAYKLRELLDLYNPNPHCCRRRLV